MTERRVSKIFLSVSLLMVAFAVQSVVLADSVLVESAVGVRVGDWVKYEIAATWTSNVPDAEPPPDFAELDKVEWIKNTVSAVSGSNITFETVTHYKDGEEAKSTEYVDVKTGDSSSLGALMFIPSNLHKGDTIHASSTEQYSINETISRSYLDMTRETNHLNVSTVYYETQSLVTVFNANYYWDKLTGVLLERPGTYVTYAEGAVTTVSISEKIVDTNILVEKPDGQPPGAEVGVIILVALLLIALFVWRWKK